MRKEAGFQCAAHCLRARVRGAHSDDVGAAFEHVDRYLYGEVLIGLNNIAVLIKVIDEHPAAGPALLQQIAVAHERGEVGAGGIVADVDKGRVQQFPLAVYLALDLG